MEDDDKVKCPQCGSTQVHAEKRGWNIFVGFFGSSQIVLTCLRCAHKFSPGADFRARKRRNQAKGRPGWVMIENDGKLFRGPAPNNPVEVWTTAFGWMPCAGAGQPKEPGWGAIIDEADAQRLML